MGDEWSREAGWTKLPIVLETIHEAGKQSLGPTDLVGVVDEALVRPADGGSVALGRGQPQLGNEQTRRESEDSTRMNICIENSKQDVRVTSNNIWNLKL